MSEPKAGPRSRTTGALLRLVDRLIPWGAVVLAPALLLGPGILAGRVLFWGTPMLQFIPWRRYALHLLQEGYLPLWNPLVGMGAPLLANYQSALLYPPNWLLAVLGVEWGHGPLLLIHLALAGCGMVALGRRLGFRALSAGLAGLAYALSGYLVARAGFFSINAATAWVPLILLGVEGISRSQDEGVQRKAIILLVGSWSMQWLAGHAQTAWYTLLLTACWWLWRTVERRGWRGVPRGLPGLLAPGLLAFMLAAPQLLPTLEYLSHSGRAAAVDRELALTYSFWPWRFLELVAPGLFGHPASGDFWGYANYWEDAIYIGVLPFVLALGGAVASMRRNGQHHRLGRFLLVLLAISGLLSLGKNTPIFPWLYDHIPTFDLFQAPTRWSLIMVISLALLAGIGAERWGPPAGRALYWTRLGTAGAAAVVAAAVLAGILLPDVRSTFLLGFGLGGLWLFVAGALSLSQPRPRAPWWRLAVIGFVATDLLIATWNHIPMASPEIYQGESHVGELDVGSHRLYLAPQAEYDLKFYEFFRFDTFQAASDWSDVRDWGLPNTPMLERIRSANNFDPLLPRRYETWIAALDGLAPARQRPFLAMMDVRQVQFEVAPDAPRFEPIDSPRRARWISRAVAARGPEDALEKVLAPSFDPSSTVVIEGPVSTQGGVSGGQVMDLAEEGPNHVEVWVEADGQGWLLLADANFPGWKAFIDDRPAEIRPANYLFRAVQVPAGSHRVRFEYRPLSFSLGLALFAVGLLASGWFLWRRE